MEKVVVSGQILKKLEKHALESLPNECIGIFECMFSNGRLEITETYECKNVAIDKKHGALLTKRDMRFFNKKRIPLERHNIFYGVYHSHPVSGDLILSPQDKHSAKFYKMFRIQLILGIKKNVVRMIFWRKKPKIWRKAKLIKIGQT
jgi:proteasome lid subunit RPN8/RPN11